jgi:hypothetical protein
MWWKNRNARWFLQPTDEAAKVTVPDLCVGVKIKDSQIKLKIANFVFVPTLQLLSLINANPPEEFNGQR